MILAAARAFVLWPTLIRSVALSILASVTTSLKNVLKMRYQVALGEHCRRRTDEEKSAIRQQVGRDGYTVADVARWHDVTHQHIHQWRQHLRKKSLLPRESDTFFLPLVMDRSSAPL
jgi:hypothetical protein